MSFVLTVREDASGADQWLSAKAREGAGCGGSSSQLASSAADPVASVKPSAPCPILSQRLRYGVGPMIGVPRGVAGRRPVHSLTSPCPAATFGKRRGFGAQSGQTLGIGLERVSLEVGHAGHAQPVSQAGIDDLMREVGHADFGRN